MLEFRQRKTGMSKSKLRKEAYRYIRERLCKLAASHHNIDQHINISLEELEMLKEGITDPSDALVAGFKQLFTGIVSEAEIDTQLVEPFKRLK